MTDTRLKQAKKEIAAVEAALKAGHPPSQGTRNLKSAIRVAGDKLGVDRLTFKGRIGSPDSAGSWKKRFGLEPDWSLYVAPPSLDLGDQPAVSIPKPKDVRLEDEVRVLRKALKDQYRENDTAEIIREIVGGIAEAPREMPRWVTEPAQRQKHKPTPEVPVTIWSDWHLGEVVEAEEVNGFNEFNMAIAEARIERLVNGTIKLCREHHTGVYPGIVVNLGGDFVSGGLHPELKATDEEEVLPASLKALDWLIAGLRRMADAFGQVYVPCAAGNHGRHTAKPEFKRYYKKNFDWLIYSLLARHFADDKRIQFDIRPSNDVHYKVFGQRYLLTHGDMLGVKGGDGIIGSIGPIMRGEVKKSGQSSVLGVPFDKVLMGHWHQRLWLPRAVVNSALKGFDEYAKNQLGAKPDRPTQALWFVHPAHGMTAHWDVYVDDAPAVTDEWVSFRAGAA